MITLHIEVIPSGTVWRWRRVCSAVSKVSEQAWLTFQEALVAARRVAASYSFIESKVIAVKNDPCHDAWMKEGSVSFEWTILDEDTVPFDFMRDRDD